MEWVDTGGLSPPAVRRVGSSPTPSTRHILNRKNIMKINKDSWHYRFLNKCLAGPPPTSLCAYVRSLVFYMFLWSGISVIAAYLLLAPVAFLLTLFIEYFRDIPREIDGKGTFWGVLVAVGLVELGIVVLVGIYFALYKSSEALQKKFWKNSSKKDKQPNIFWGYMKAVHKKVCPMLEFVDKE